MAEFKDFFISYGRRESLGFVARLHRELKLAGYDAWFDKVNIPDGDDYAERINHGIESAHNFVVVMAPRLLTSPYCLIELEYARILGKRVIPVNQSVIFDAPEQELSEEDRQVLANFYRHHGAPDPNILTTMDVLKRAHALVGATDWVDGKETLSDDDCNRLMEWARPYENYWHKHDDPEYLRDLDPDAMCFGTCVDDLSGVAERVMTVTERRRDYVHAHTEVLEKALRWQKNQRVNRFLLTGKERRTAEEWLLAEFHPPNQPPCIPSDLHCDFICESRKNAENLMTDVFICHASDDRHIRDQVIRSLSRCAVTAWTHDRDIQKGADYGRAIKEGIENADNFFFFICPGSVASEYCRKELDHALRYEKRIVPLLIASTPEADIPETVRRLQYTDFTDNEDPSDYDRDIDDILRILRHDRAYYKDHKILLACALKWDAEDRKSSFLLRGFNLENAQTWLRMNNQRTEHPPTELHVDLIGASVAARGSLGTDVFISYSRKDGDFARKLNTALQKAGKTTWFDQESISKGVDFEKAIYDGIEKSDNFLFVLTPDAVESEYCEGEVNYAAGLSKRFITVLSRETDPGKMPGAMRKINWIDFKDAPFDESFPELIQAIELDREHARMHTVFQQRAVEWTEHDRGEEFLMNITACVQAETWIEEADEAGKQPPPTPMHRDFITGSRASIDAAERDSRLRRWIAFTFITAGMIIAMILAGYAFHEQRIAEKNYKQAKANELAHISAALRDDGDYTRAIRVAQAAYEIDQEHAPASVNQALIDAHNMVAIGKQSFFYQNVLYHESGLNMAEYSPDGKVILTASKDGTAKIWSDKGKLKAILPHGANIRKAVFSVDGARIVTMGAGKMLKLWSADGELIKDLHGHGCDDQGHCQVNNVAFSPDGERMVSVADDSSIILWDKNGNLLHKEDKAHRKFIYVAGFSPDGSKLVTASGDLKSSVTLWDGSTVRRLSDIVEDSCPHQEKWLCGISEALFSSNGQRIFVASSDHGFRVFDLKGNLLEKCDQHSKNVRVLVPTPDGKGVAGGTEDGVIIEWNEAGIVRRQIPAHIGAINSLAYSKDGSLLLSAGADHSAKLWDERGRLLINYRGHKDEVNTARFSPVQPFIVTASSDGSARLWSVQGITTPVFHHENYLATALFIHDGKRILIGMEGPKVLLWNIDNASVIREYGPYGADDFGNRRFYSLSLSPDGKRFVSTCNDYLIRIQDVETGETIKSWEGVHRRSCTPNGWCGPTNAVYSKDGGMIATTDFIGKVAIWDAEGNFIHQFQDDDKKEIRGLAFSPDSRNLLTGSHSNTVKLWSMKGELIRKFDGHKAYVYWVAFSPDGKWIASASADHTSRLWHTEGKKSTVILKGHNNEVRSIAFSSNGNYVATASNDKTAKIWDMNGQLIRTLKGHQKPVRTAVFSPSGETVLTASEDMDARIWHSTKYIYEWLIKANLYQLSNEERKNLALKNTDR